MIFRSGTCLQPGNATNNITLEKGFDFHERGTLILRGEAENIANHNTRLLEARTL